MTSKLQNCSKSTKIWHYVYLTLTLHNGNVFANTTKIPVSLSFIVTEIWPGQNANSKSGFLAKTSKFLAKLNFNFSLHNLSRYIIFRIFCNFCTKGFWRYGSDKESVTDKQTDGSTDGSTDGHTRREKQYMSPAGETYNSIQIRWIHIWCCFEPGFYSYEAWSLLYDIFPMLSLYAK